MHENKTQPLLKITIPLDAEEWHGYATESVWADKIDAKRCRIRNTPFYAKGISFEDIVFVKTVDGELFFDSVSIAAGHSTYRIITEKKLPEAGFLKHWRTLEEIGCTYEGADLGTLRLFAIDVPPGASIHQVYELLALGEKDGCWDFEEGHCGHDSNEPPLHNPE